MIGYILKMEQEEKHQDLHFYLYYDLLLIITVL